MALLDLNITELCDWRTKTFNKAGYATVLAADPAVTTRLLAKLDPGQYHKTPYWRAVVAAAAERQGHRCANCGHHVRPRDMAGIAAPTLIRGTEHQHLDQVAVIHHNAFTCKAHARVA